MAHIKSKSATAALLSALCAFATQSALADKNFNAGTEESPTKLVSDSGYLAFYGNASSTETDYKMAYFQVDGDISATKLILSSTGNGKISNHTVYFSDGASATLSDTEAVSWNGSSAATISLTTKNDTDKATVNLTNKNVSLSVKYSSGNYASKLEIGKGITVNAAGNFAFTGGYKSGGTGVRANNADIYGKINIANTFQHTDGQFNLYAGSSLAAKNLIATGNSEIRVFGNMSIKNAGQDIGYSHKIIRVMKGGLLELEGSFFASTYYIIFESGAKLKSDLGRLTLKRTGHINVLDGNYIDLSATDVVVQDGVPSDGPSILVGSKSTLKIGTLGYSNANPMQTKVQIGNNSTLVLEKLAIDDVNIGKLGDKYTLNVTLGENASLLLLDYVAERDDAALKYITIKNNTDNLAWIKTTFEGADAWKLTAVPEPAEWAAIFGAAALALTAYRRRK